MATGLIRVGIVGLGVAGQRALDVLIGHESFTVTRAWDPHGAVREAVSAAYPDLEVADAAAAVCESDQVDALWLAGPPASHVEQVDAALAAGKPFLCEVPLAVDVDEARKLVARVEQSGIAAAANFVHASARSVAALAEKIDEGALGEILGVDLELHLRRWPRRWQASAEWVAGRAQGGFVREVVSHFVFLAHRLFGPAAIKHLELRYPDDPELAEIGLLASLVCGPVPLVINGRVGGAGPARTDFTVWGSDTTYRLYDWYRLKRSEGAEWAEMLGNIRNPGLDSRMRQLGNWETMLRRGEQALPGLKEAFAVQELIETMLQG